MATDHAPGKHHPGQCRRGTADFATQGGKAMKQRASLFLDFIRTHYAGQTVLAVGHGIINKAIQSVFYDKPTNQIVPMKNAEVRCLELT